MMSDEPIKHVIRPAPLWSTCEQITVCGNLVRPGDLTMNEMLGYIRAECRGSRHVAYRSCCVTCLNSLPNVRREAQIEGVVS